MFIKVKVTNNERELRGNVLEANTLKVRLIPSLKCVLRYDRFLEVCGVREVATCKEHNSCSTQNSKAQNIYT